MYQSNNVVKQRYVRVLNRFLGMIEICRNDDDGCYGILLCCWELLGCGMDTYTRYNKYVSFRLQQNCPNAFFALLATLVARASIRGGKYSRGNSVLCECVHLSKRYRIHARRLDVIYIIAHFSFTKSSTGNFLMCSVYIYTL